MQDLKRAHLADRGVIRITGADAVKLLDGLITNAMSAIDDKGAIHTGLLSPQGKILFDFFVTRDGDDLLVDIATASISDLIKRLSFYRLRADVTFTDETATLAVAAAWTTGGTTAADMSASQDDLRFPGGVIATHDPRLAALGWRLILPRERLPELPGTAVDEADYHAHRIAVGVPDAGHDYELGDTFPHEALYDQLASVDFRKGCYIGQEVVSRMQHRGTARKRIVPIEAATDIAAGADVMMGEAAIGKIGTSAGHRALALIRLDRANEAPAKNLTLQAGDTPVRITKPDWLAIDIATGKPADKAGTSQA